MSIRSSFPQGLSLLVLSSAHCSAKTDDETLLAPNCIPFDLEIDVPGKAGDGIAELAIDIEGIPEVVALGSTGGAEVGRPMLAPGADAIVLCISVAASYDGE